MNYIDLVYNGLFQTKNLYDFLFSELEKAIRHNFISPKLFFSNCISVFDCWESKYKNEKSVITVYNENKSKQIKLSFKDFFEYKTIFLINYELLLKNHLSKQNEKNELLQKRIDIKKERNELLQSKNETLETEYKLLESEYKLLESAKPPQFTELYKELKGKWIDNISEAEFNYFINYRQFAPDAPKAKWIGKKADAWRFLHWIDPKETETNFNKWFECETGNKLNLCDKNGITLEKSGTIWDILKNNTK